VVVADDVPKENPVAVGAVVLTVPNNGVLVAGFDVTPKGDAVVEVLRDDAVEPNGELEAAGAVKLLPKIGADVPPVDALPKSGVAVVVVAGAGVAPNNEFDDGAAVVEADAPNNVGLVVEVDCVEPKGDAAVLEPPNIGVEVAG
jgi:hypothetical protein